MSQNILLFNKPYHVLSQFTDTASRQHLGHYINEPGFYAAGRLDYDSEGLMLLTNDGKIQHHVAGSDTHKSYLIQVEGRVQAKHLQQLRQGVKVKDYVARALHAETLAKKPAWLWKRNPPIRVRQNIPTSWMMLTINQGKNRQVRRMSAAVGLPVLRLVRTQIGPYELGQMQPGEYKIEKYPSKQ
ncbi:pseudouridine synthase [Marinicella sp. S1101]|uniref:pseudouridine synthase n=1 Tax=Marinicella marina TaxID=2996016 RepID=UPI002260B99C|nr:pseudouridine synthase [Marinicella marina]MCX7552301.1 pseudouridine synthase [Marinicella marina]MDJ1139176.1 pseudouridine synthase [Marinicella marina]